MKIEINRIPPEGLILEEEFSVAALDLGTEIVNFSSPIKITANASKITNALTVNLALQASMLAICSRCLEEFAIDFKKAVTLNYPVERSQLVVDLSPDIREEIILDYPIKPLCKPDCLGLCLKCGRNLNEGGCHCATTKKKTF